MPVQLGKLVKCTNKLLELVERVVYLYTLLNVRFVQKILCRMREIVGEFCSYNHGVLSVAVPELVRKIFNNFVLSVETHSRRRNNIALV